jgi:diacylglycerol kinase family enzyme
MGGGFFMAPQAEMDDCQFNICIAEEVSKAKIFYLIYHFMKGTQASQKEIRTGMTDEIKVIANDGSLPAHADGETICVDGIDLTLEINPKAIKVIC